jgi:D-alanine-D-alanine ligase
MGGFSSEREVSLASGEGCANALREAGYDVTAIDVTRDIPALLAALDPAPDVVFNALHGTFGEDGRIQGLLDMLAIPYTHSGAVASALAMEKDVSRVLLDAAGLPLAPGEVIRRSDLLARGEPERPYVFKPLAEGSSVGVELVFEEDKAGFPDSIRMGGADDLVLIEKFIPGREIQVAVMGDRALGAIEIRTDRRFYDYVAKYTPGASTHIMPAPIHPDAYAQSLDLSVRSHAALGCRGVSRVDLRYDDTAGEPGKFYILEVNTQPGMTPTSLVPEIAADAGISFPDLVRWMVEEAQCDG